MRRPQGGRAHAIGAHSWHELGDRALSTCDPIPRVAPLLWIQTAAAPPDTQETDPFSGVLTEEVGVDGKIKRPEGVDGIGPGQRPPVGQMCGGHMFPLQPAVET